MTPLSIIVFLIVGTVAGLIAAKAMRGHSLGIFGNMVVGVVGAVLGGLILSLVGVGFGGWLGTFLTALVGAIALLAIVNLFTRRHVRY